jgi:hypothetical protein
MGKIYGQQNQKVKKCAECGGAAKVYDLRSKTWWCVPDFKDLLKDYDGDPQPDPDGGEAVLRAA